MKGRIQRQKAESDFKLPIAGKIRIGEKSANGYPRSLDYFKATGKYASKFNECFGNNPNQITIIFVNDDPLYSCNERYEGRGDGGRLYGTGDGLTWETLDFGSGEYDNTPEEKMREYTKQHALKWSTILTIRFIIPDLRGLFGIWELSTKGEKSSIGAIRDTFDYVLREDGTVLNVPFDLNVEMATSQKPQSKSRFPVLSLVPHLSSENITKIRELASSGSDIKSIGMITEEKLLEIELHD